MLKSYNGWTASKNPADFGGLDNRPIPGTVTDDDPDGVHYSPGIRAGSVAVIAFWWGWQWHTRIERLTDTIGCWGWYFKQSANSKALLSAHSGASAWDTAATRHPNGKRGTLTGPALQAGRTQLQVLRELLAYLEGVVYSGVDAWGGGTPDEMHAEIATGATEDDVDRVAAKILRDYGPIHTWAAQHPTLGGAIGTLPDTPEDDMFSDEDRTKLGDLHRMMDAFKGGSEVDQYKPFFVSTATEGTSKVLRTEGVSGAGDLGRLTAAVVAALPAGQSYHSAEDIGGALAKVLRDGVDNVGG